jgi:hypothetical protein
MKQLSTVGALLIFVSMILSACRPGQMFGPTITPLPTQTSTPTLTPTNTPTNTNTPTATSTPTTAYTPTPTINLEKPISSYLTDVTVTYSDWFDTSTNDQWLLPGDGSFTFQGGLLSVNGDGTGIIRLNKIYTEGTGSIISFKLDELSNFVFFYDYGVWATRDFKMYGLSLGPRDGNSVNTWFGSTWAGQQIGNIKTGTWYNLLLAIGKGPKFRLVVWDRDSGSILYDYSRPIPQWSNLNWNLVINSFYGHAEFDNFADISFSGMK